MRRASSPETPILHGPAANASLHDERSRLLGDGHPAIDKTALATLEMADDPLITLISLTKHLRDIQRLPKWDSETKENNAEHSYMVSLLATEYKYKFYPDDPEIDDAKVKEYAEIHDWVEILAGDTVTLGMTEMEYIEKAEFEEECLAALLELLRAKGLSRHADLLQEYENQSDKSARFVKAVDKLMPSFLNIIGDGVGPRIDHGINSSDSLKSAHALDRHRFESRFCEEFPELLAEYNKYQDRSTEAFCAAVDTVHYDENGSPIIGLGHYSI